MSVSHFVQAQEPVYDQALRELRSGHKCSHWIWFIFPQLGALGRSVRAQFFGLTDVMPQEPVFVQALKVFYDSQADPATMALCGRAGLASDAL